MNGLNPQTLGRCASAAAAAPDPVPWGAGARREAADAGGAAGAGCSARRATSSPPESRFPSRAPALWSAAAGAQPGWRCARCARSLPELALEPESEARIAGRERSQPDRGHCPMRREGRSRIMRPPYIPKRVVVTIRQLGDPTKNALESWLREYEQRLELSSGYLRWPALVRGARAEQVRAAGCARIAQSGSRRGR
jgi:hypothetical protein